MSASITLPMWLIIVIGGLAAWALLDRLLMLSMRWWVKSRANRVLDEVGRRLKIGIRPFQQVKRQALILSRQSRNQTSNTIPGELMAR